MITAQIIADSINPYGQRITTGLWTYPRFIHSEVLTHRMFARNAASSRAIPVEKMIEAVLTNPATFEQYGKANKGMQAQELMDEDKMAHFLSDWIAAGHQTAHFAELWKDEAAKQLVNRALEPWMHMTIIVTATEWHNFFALRAHPDAQPEFQVLAYRWLDQYLKSTPVQKNWGEWHLPLTEDVAVTSRPEVSCKISVARCARVSYTKHADIKELEDDLKLHDRLQSAGHMSPFEHQAQATMNNSGSVDCGSFKGWRPYRKILPHENRSVVDLNEIMSNKPDWVTL